MTPGPLVVFACLLLGCAGGSGFTRTDPNFLPARRSNPPELFLEQLPSRPYRAVGRVAVIVAADAQLSEVQNAVLHEGQEAGCDLLVEPSLERRSTLMFAPASRNSVRLVHGGSHGGGQGAVQARRPAEAPGGRYEFICGVYAAVST